MSQVFPNCTSKSQSILHFLSLFEKRVINHGAETRKMFKLKLNFQLSDSLPPALHCRLDCYQWDMKWWWLWFTERNVILFRSQPRQYHGRLEKTKNSFLFISCIFVILKLKWIVFCFFRSLIVPDTVLIFPYDKR